MKKRFTLLFLCFGFAASAQKLEVLTVEKIMRHPKWIGVSPSNIRWSDDSKKIYFNWNPDKAERDELFYISPNNTKPQKAGLAERRDMVPEGGKWNKARTLKTYEDDGDIYLWQANTGKVVQLTHTTGRESNPTFTGDESSVIYTYDNNLYQLKLGKSELTQLTNFVKTACEKKPAKDNEQARWLKKQQAELFDIIKAEEKDRKLDSAERALLKTDKLKEIAFGDKRLSSMQVSPNGRYITYRLTQAAEGARAGIVPNYVTASGYTEDIPNRTKVGAPQAASEGFIFDTQRDSVYAIVTKNIPGIKDIPAFYNDYPKELEALKKANADRRVDLSAPFWSPDGKQAVVNIDAQDNKDRWLMLLDAATGKLTLLDRQHDDAWIGGPGTGAWFADGSLGWADNTHFYYQSEASGYSHLYLADVVNGNKKQLTSGKWEVQTLRLSNDKKTFYFTANIDHPGITQFYRIPVTGGAPVKITGIKGGNEIGLSPDEKWIAIRHSYSNQPWELYVQPNKPGVQAIQITHSTTAEFNTYPWREPEVISFKNRNGKDIYARVYVPKNPDPAKPAVVFVHGAGYLQNAHYWWSSYFREYMFNNMLADNGYTVMDIDYTASSGYGRDIRTGIYRHMGGADLTDQVDGVKLLADKYGVNPKHVGLYGGSYGGFITLMAMFTQPDVFAAGAALRSVTDWAHYNHGYTSNILNEPFNDEKAYRQSSPIYFADGLKGWLLMLHGMVDENVNFQDIVRLSQRLIELHKENWELAPYPVEDHGFVQPSSWTDEYKRIFKLFEETLKK
ncbi:S9 family peptidase [Mucilaginibacter phyllosphaerae]|uniref:Dipeptidyl aminopeptidase/acylaminoacyl peptidase n=1 Tax=Mucilaginibacter phyllosphaerae TaxID=1812349 RepID=A0A4Y8A7M7_9SPHI|nr:prolyl oligopeptidase family serine peptidase [Mucilaginibacter phyllosphaerae]MBB3971070.1 dipeptidyl aminopeptidase/acylaminoacyl peptidase [Mucilaginibacter phyllosphaerae]TEW63808.1 S9 family peptidase [Mucilaginibacter phyllosphaerae]GGH22292.1 peptidase S9 [Mucilaginibacter phyllosphaerae]